MRTAAAHVRGFEVADGVPPGAGVNRNDVR